MSEGEMKAGLNGMPMFGFPKIHLLGSKLRTDVFTLSATQARKVFDTVSAQNKELWELTQKLAAETGEPMRKHVTKVLQPAS